MSMADADLPDSDDTLSNIGLGGLAFRSHRRLEIGSVARICFSILGQDSSLTGTVVWCRLAEDGYDIGIRFSNLADIFQLRMIEQICHIEHYRQQVKINEGRDIDSEQAASEWIRLFAHDFPDPGQS